MIEEWRTIPSIPKYSASSFGRISNTKTLKIKAQRIRWDRRVDVALWNNGKLKGTLVHRLVAEAFIGPQPTGMETNHKDGNPANNSASNLEWVTRSDNLRHAYSNGLNSQLGSENGNAKLNDLAVYQIKGLLDVGFGQKVIAAIFQTPRVTINHISRGRTWAHISYP
jgi:hypothetical protein